MKTDTDKRLFCQLVHVAKTQRAWQMPVRHLHLSGMLRVMKDNREDFTIADDMRSVWKHQRSSAD